MGVRKELDIMFRLNGITGPEGCAAAQHFIEFNFGCQLKSFGRIGSYKIQMCSASRPVDDSSFASGLVSSVQP
eukprot:2381636-Pyramimonas_sp.AAC.1